MIFDIIHLISMKSNSLCFLSLQYKIKNLYIDIPFIRVAHNPKYSSTKLCHKTC